MGWVGGGGGDIICNVPFHSLILHTRIILRIPPPPFKIPPQIFTKTGIPIYNMKNKRGYMEKPICHIYINIYMKKRGFIRNKMEEIGYGRGEKKNGGKGGRGVVVVE